MKIFYLYTEVIGYTIATIRNLVERGNEVHMVYWDHKRQTPYQMPLLSNVITYKRSELSDSEIKKLAKNIMPGVTVISGWMDKGYMRVAKQLRAEGMPVVVGLDNQWQGTAKQRIGMLLGAAGYFLQFYSHAWVAGLYQFEYARRIGFEKKNIVYDLYSADLCLFRPSLR